MQDFSSYVSVLLSNRATREAAFAMIRDRWTETRAKADSPMILRRLVEALAGLPERRHYDAVRAFLDAHPIDGAKPGDRPDAGAHADGRHPPRPHPAAHQRLAPPRR